MKHSPIHIVLVIRKYYLRFSEIISVKTDKNGEILTSATEILA